MTWPLERACVLKRPTGAPNRSEALGFYIDAERRTDVVCILISNTFYSVHVQGERASNVLLNAVIGALAVRVQSSTE